MRKFLPASFAAAALFALCACEKTDEAANRAFVLASSKVAKASAYFEGGKYSDALNYCLDARADAARILENYQGTRIALEMVKDSNTHMGPCTYNELQQTVIPRLEVLAAQEMEPVRLAWAVALANADAAKRDEALSKLATILIYAQNEEKALEAEGFTLPQKLPEEQIGMMINSCVARITLPAYKNSVMSIRAAHLQGSNAQMVEEFKRKAQERGAQVKTTVRIHPAASPKLENPKKFIEDARKLASMINYDMANAKKLREAASSARGLGAQEMKEYEAALKTAFTNAGKISMPKMRQQALADVSAAAANAGRNNVALEFFRDIKDEKLAQELVSVMAESFSKDSEYSEALAVISKLKSGQEKDDFLFRTAISLAKEGMADQAYGIAKGFKDAALRNSCVIIIGCVAPGADISKMAETLKDMDPASIPQEAVTTLSETLVPAKVVCDSAEGRHAARLAAIAGRLSPIDAALSEKWNRAAKDAILEVAAPKEFSLLLPEVCETQIKNGDAKGAFEMVQKCAFRITDDAVFTALCKSAVFFALSKHDSYAVQVFEMAASVCASREKPRIQNEVELAWKISLSGISHGDAVKILKPFLPRF